MRSRRFTRPGLGGVRLHALHHGGDSRPTLVLLHGGGANAHWWDPVAPRLAERFHVVALDFRGHGDSDYPDLVEPGAFGRDLEALLEELDAPDAALVGHSMGGHVALAWAAEGARPRALVAVEATRGAGRRDRRRMRLALGARRSYRTREEAVARFRFLPPSPHDREATRRAVAEHSVRLEADGRYGFKFDPRWFRVPPSAPPDLSRVRAPTLVLRGAESPLLSAEGAASLAAEIPGARWAEIPDAAHNPQLEQPEGFLAQVEPFLAAHA